MADYGADWERTRQRVLRRDGHRCVRCGRRGGPNGDATLHVHHVEARSEGGTDRASNLVTLCGACHGGEHGNPQLKSSDRRRAGAPRRASRARKRRRRVGRGRY